MACKTVVTIIFDSFPRVFWEIFFSWYLRTSVAKWFWDPPPHAIKKTCGPFTRIAVSIYCLSIRTDLPQLSGFIVLIAWSCWQLSDRVEYTKYSPNPLERRFERWKSNRFRPPVIVKLMQTAVKIVYEEPRAVLRNSNIVTRQIRLLDKLVLLFHFTRCFRTGSFAMKNVYLLLFMIRYCFVICHETSIKWAYYCCMSLVMRIKLQVNLYCYGFSILMCFQVIIFFSGEIKLWIYLWYILQKNFLILFHVTKCFRTGYCILLSSYITV